MTKPQYQHATAAKLRELARRDDVEIVITYHCQERMEQRGIVLPDVMHILETGTVTNEELHPGGMRHTVEGATVDGNRISLIVVINESKRRIYTITIWDSE